MIRIENLRKEFDKGVVALDSINLTFEEGSFIAPASTMRRKRSG